MLDASLTCQLSVMVLALSAVPVARLCVMPVLWSKYRNAGLVIITALASYATLIAIAWQSYPRLLPYAAIIAAILTVYFWWRARPGFGVKRGLPYGSLSMVRSLGSVYDPGYYLEQGSKFDQVFKMSQFHRPTFCVTNIDKGLDLIRNNETKLTPPGLKFDRFIPRRFIRYMDQEDHGHYREILKQIFQPRIIDANKILIKAAAASHIRRMCEDSSQKPGVHPISFMRDFTYDVFPAMFFGLEPGSKDLRHLQSYYHSLDEYNLRNRYPQDIEDILLEMEAIILTSAKRLSSLRQEGHRSSFLEELVLNDPDAIDDISLRRNMIYLMGNGQNDVTDLLIWVWYFLGQNPWWLEKVRLESEPGHLINWRRLDSTVDRIIAETLRMEQSEYLYREALDEVEWNGLRIPKGWLVRVCTHEGHRDAGLFPHADEFNPDRFLPRKFLPTEYSPLGLGIHSCLGTHLIFSVVRYLVLHLASEYEIEIVNAGKRSSGDKHWMHWRPGDAFAVKVQPRWDANGLE